MNFISIFVDVSEILKYAKIILFKIWIYPMDIQTELTKSRAFAGVTTEAIADLIHAAKEVHLQKEQILFHQGDVADSFYVVLVGRVLAILEHEGQSRIVTDILPGEIIGEVTLLSSKTRTMTVTAVLPTTMLKISKKTMIKFCLKNPQVLINILNILAERSTQTLKLLSLTNVNHYVALIKLGEHQRYADFFSTLKAELSLHSTNSVVIKTPTAETATIANYPDFLQHLTYQVSKKQEIFQELDLNQHFFSQCFIENATHEVIFVLADADTKTLLEYNQIANITQLKSHVRRSLVLIHNANVKLPKNTARWLQAGKFTTHYHVRLSNRADLERLARFLLGCANGLVISGGAARSIIGMGTVKALLERNIPIDALGGTSMGAVLTAFLLFSKNYSDYLKNCERIIGAIKNWNTFWAITWPLVSIYSGAKGTQEIKKICGDLRIEDQWLPYYAITCNYSDSTESVQRQGLLWQILRATTALPGLVPPCVIDDKVHVDGGLTNNFPTDIMRDIVGPHGLIIGVNSFTPVDVPKKYKFPPVMPLGDALLTKLGWRNKDYVYPGILDLLMKTFFISSIQRQYENREYTDILIQPDLRKYRFSDFVYYQELLDLGYQETLRVFDEKLKH